MIRSIITLMICLSTGLSNGQSLVDYPNLVYNFFDQVVLETANEFAIDSCVLVKGQLTDTEFNAMSLDYVRVQIIDLETEEVIHLTTEGDGSFEKCLSCERTYIILSYPRDYYCEEVRLELNAAHCQSGNKLKINLPLQALEIVETEGEGSNMSSIELDSVEMDSIENLRKANKTFLESISIAEDVPVEVEKIPQDYVAPPGPRLNSTPEVNKEDEDFDDITEISEQETTSEKLNKKPTESEAAISDHIPMIFSPIYYPFDSDALDQKDESVLNELSQYLLANPELHLQVASYTDPRGTKAYNKRLAKKRAQSVVEFLLKNGVEQTRLIAQAKGEISDTTDYEKARRTELKISRSAPTDIGAIDIPLSGEKYTSKIYYEFDDFRLNAPSKEDLAKIVERMIADPSLTVEVHSHTDARGSAQYNQWLSQKRANEVVRKMVEAGVEQERIKGIGFGETALVNQCSDGVSCSRSEHAQNRRTEFVFL